MQGCSDTCEIYIMHIYYILTSTLISFLTLQSKRMVNKIDKMLLLPIRRIKWQEEIKTLSSIIIKHAYWLWRSDWKKRSEWLNEILFIAHTKIQWHHRTVIWNSLSVCIGVLKYKNVLEKRLLIKMYQCYQYNSAILLKAYFFLYSRIVGNGNLQYWNSFSTITLEINWFSCK